MSETNKPDDPPQDAARTESTPRTSLGELVDRLPTDPGVYLMKDRRGKHLYIGKAANLRARVRQYFSPTSGDSRDFVPLLEGLVADIETIVTRNEKEALLLENTLIKAHQPRFNIKLRDDSNYLVLRLDPKAEWPRLEVVRQLGNDGAWYFGPYHSATACREALRVVNRHFQLRTCTDHVLHNRRRPCLQYQIKRCPAPCVLPVPPAEYDEQVRDVRLFLDGKSGELLNGLRLRMKETAARAEFERAATARDQLFALEKTLEAQHVVQAGQRNQDLFGFHREGIALDIAVVAIRDGKMQGSRSFSFTGQEFPDHEILSSFLGLYYDLNPSPPDEVLLPFDILDAGVKAEWLDEMRQHPHGKKVEILVPERGPKRDLVILAQKNAAANFVSRRNRHADSEETLGKLQRRLKLPRLPRVIEGYDVSHVQGSDTVASLVVFVDGAPEKSRYRTYKLKRARGNDDFAAMYEVLSRRFRRSKGPGAGDSSKDEPWPLPDLIVVDGGKGQLGMALAAARDQDIDIRPGTGLPIVALAKERELQAEAPIAGDRPAPRASDKTPDRVFLPNAKDAIPIRPNSAELYVLARLRDEAHRFAVGFHRKQRTRRALGSVLGQVHGIGHERQRLLLRHFGSVKKIREAALDDLVAVPGMSHAAAKAVFEFFAKVGADDPARTATAAEEADDDAVQSAFAEVETDGADEVTAEGSRGIRDVHRR